MGFGIKITLSMKKDRHELGILKQLVEKMKNDPWHVKLRRWWKFKRWMWKHRS